MPSSAGWSPPSPAGSATSTSPRRWPRRPSSRPSAAGPPRACRPTPAGWLTVTARNKALDRLRRESTRQARHEEAVMLTAPEDPGRPGHVGDRRAAAAALHLLPPGARARGAGGPDPAAARRAHRARGGRAPSSCPSARWRSGSPGPSARSPRPTSPTGSRATTSCPDGCAACSPSSTSSSPRATCPASGEDGIRDDLCAEAIRLGRVLRELMPDEPEVAGLLALMLLTDARRAARLDAGGALVTLDARTARSGTAR